MRCTIIVAALAAFLAGCGGGGGGSNGGGAATGAASEADVRAYLAANAAARGLDPSLRDLALERVQESPLGQHFVFRQLVAGVPVYRAEVKVHVGPDGSIFGLDSSYRPEAAVAAVTAGIPPDAAVEAARAAMPATDIGTPGLAAAVTDLFVYPAASGFRLAWRVRQEIDEGATWETFVDAQDGAVLAEPRDIRRLAGTYAASGAGRVFLTNAIVASRNDDLTDQADAAAAVPNAAYSDVALERLAGNGYLDGKYASTRYSRKITRAYSSANRFVYDRSKTGFSECMAVFHVDRVQAYLQSLGLTAANNRQQGLNVNGTRQDNSWYDPANRVITYGSGGVDDAEDADIIVHEYGHAIQDDIVPDFGWGAESGAMGEGFGDYLAGSLAAEYDPSYAVSIAEWDAAAGGGTIPYLRRLDSRKVYPDDFVDEVHEDGEMWSAALWEIRGAIGARKADLLIVAHHYLLDADPSFLDAAEALVTAATRLRYASADLAAIRSRLAARGFAVSN